ncbi:MAG: A24 family peptidase [Phycisphaerales bacterium]|jgi:leader peptidase (prepilin peptidase) / N-methyltransferase|nr:A24 family peptidase [Phycisphaerales bacterium]
MINIAFVIAFAACVGSFLNVVIYRLPRGESLWFPGSRCPKCGYAIKWFDNIPMLSWLVLRGKCRQCKTPISPRYLIIEALTAALAVGLYVCFYALNMREGLGVFQDSWITFIAYGALITGLLACSIIDLEHWIVPLEVCWSISVIGVIAAGACPPSDKILAQVSPGLGAAGIGALLGLVISLILLRKGVMQQSFIDAENKPASEPEPDKTEPKPAPPKGGPLANFLGEILFLAPIAVFGTIAFFLVSSAPAAPGRPVLTNRAMDFCIVITGALMGLGVSVLLRRMGFIQRGLMDSQEAPPAVAFTKEHGVNPRLEILWELLFLAPAIILAIGAYLLVTQVDVISSAWGYLNDTRLDYVNGNYTWRPGWRFAPNLVAVQGAIYGYLIGGAWIWGMRIFGTLGFGKEAMGLGDVHILAAVGAVCGWIVPSLVFFVAPMVALIWAIHLLASGKQRELPYGPWLAAASLVVILFYDAIMELLAPSLAAFGR